MMKILSLIPFLMGFIFSLTAQSYCLDFDGTDDYVNLGQVLDFQPTDGYTIEAWIKAPPNPPGMFQQVIAKLDVTLEGWGVQLRNGSLSGYMFADVAASKYRICNAYAVINDEQWHHIAVVYDGNGEFQLYVDGSSAFATCTGTLSGPVISSSDATIGCFYSNGAPQEYWVGKLDNIRVWDTIRTQFDIVNNMNLCLSGTEPGLLALYQFEDGPGSSTLTDMTANGINGTLTNMDPATDWLTGYHPTISVIENACNAYTWIDGVTYTSDTTVQYTDTNGVCDSTLILDLFITVVDTSVTSSLGMLTANADSSTFQWLDCGNGNAPIAGETNASFTPTGSGDYAVEVTQNGCVAVSNCYPVVVSSLERTKAQSISIYPNPTTGIIQVDLSDTKAIALSVYNMHGQLVFSEPTLSNSKFAFRLDEVPGVYFLKIDTDQGIIKKKLIVVD